VKRRTVLALLSAIAIELRAGFATLSKAAGATLAASGSTALARQLAAAVERGDTPGVVALLVDRDGVLYEGCAGKLDIAGNLPMRRDAIFRIASMTKPITSVACMLLVEEGKLGLDDPVSEYLIMDCSCACCSTAANWERLDFCRITPPG